MVNATSWPLYPSMTRYSLYRGLGGPQGRSGQVRKIWPPPEFDPQSVQPVASRYTDWAIAAPVKYASIYSRRATNGNRKTIEKGETTLEWSHPSTFLKADVACDVVAYSSIRSVLSVEERPLSSETIPSVGVKNRTGRSGELWITYTWARCSFYFERVEKKNSKLSIYVLYASGFLLGRDTCRNSRNTRSTVFVVLCKK